MNLKRKKFLNLMDRIERGEVETVVIAHEDRLAWFSFAYLEHVSAKNGCTLLIANQESLSQQGRWPRISSRSWPSFRAAGTGYEKTLTDELSGGDR